MRMPTLGLLLCVAGMGACLHDQPTEVAAPSLATAATAHPVLKSPAQPVLWSGTVAEDGARSGEVPECVEVACERFDLDVALPPGVWSRGAGGLQVAVRWSSFGDNLDLYVYHESERVAVSDGIIATAQSVLVPMAENGEYRIYVAYDYDMPAEFGTPPSPSIAFEALAEVEYLPRAQPARALLPDLAARPQRNVTFDVPPPIFFEAGTPTTSCFPSEIESEGAELCLRFDQVLANIGEGPLEFRFELPDDPFATPTGSIVQTIHASDGSVEEREGGEWEFHPEHDHFHYTGFALSLLWPVEDGRRGRTPLMAQSQRRAPEPASEGRKVSFCIVDIEIDRWAEKGDAPRTYSAPACLIPVEEGGAPPFLLQGLSVGWSDVYDWFLPDQYVEASGLEDGLYILDTIVDPDDTILESDETNNCSGVFVRLSGMATAHPEAELRGPAPPCPRI